MQKRAKNEVFGHFIEFGWFNWFEISILFASYTKFACYINQYWYIAIVTSREGLESQNSGHIYRELKINSYCQLVNRSSQVRNSYHLLFLE